MPYGDGTGPWWARGAGCRRAYGFSRFERTAMTKEEEAEMLKNTKERMQAGISDIEKRLKELK